MSQERYVDSVMAGSFLGLAPRTLNEMARRGVIPAYPFGEGQRKTWRFKLSDLDSWMKSRAQCTSRPLLQRGRKQ
jgi:excisionase family DNA binding protein